MVNPPYRGKAFEFVQQSAELVEVVKVTGIVVEFGIRGRLKICCPFMGLRVRIPPMLPKHEQNRLVAAIR